MREFRDALALGPAGELMLYDRQVAAAINDRFVLNVLHQFDHQVGGCRVGCLCLVTSLTTRWVGGCSVGSRQARFDPHPCTNTDKAAIK